MKDKEKCDEEAAAIWTMECTNHQHYLMGLEVEMLKKDTEYLWSAMVSLEKTRSSALVEVRDRTWVELSEHLRDTRAKLALLTGSMEEWFGITKP